MEDNLGVLSKIVLHRVSTMFKNKKQDLKIKAFYGTSKNAVLIQIWTALITYLVLVRIKFKTKAGWGASGVLPPGANRRSWNV
jgi:hypothetical protein